MNYKEWKVWLKSLPWSLRWFPWFVLLSPIIDSTYRLKTISPFLSPPNIIGILTPILCINAIARFRKPNTSGGDFIFLVWSLLLVINSFLLIIIYSADFTTIGIILKLISPAFLFPFCRVFIRSRKNLNGILRTFLYSCIITIVLVILARLTGESRTQESRGFMRYSGFFADVGNIAFYITIGFLIFSYFYLKRSILQPLYSRKWEMLLVLFICALGLFSISHIATLGVFLTLFTLFIYYSFRSNITLVLLVVSFIGVLYMGFGKESIETHVNPLLEKEIEVYKGERPQEQGFHGRMSRWPEMIGVFSTLPVNAIIFGAPISFQDIIFLVTGVVHDDFLRILFLTGVLGFTLYSLFFIFLFIKTFGLKITDRFLGFGALIIMGLFSISMMPTMYSSLIYIIYCIFSFILLPFSYQYEK
jgi:O-antigen ligase